MADPNKKTEDKKAVDPRAAGLIQPEARSQEEIVAQAYDHEDPTPTQVENDQAKLMAMNCGEVPEGGGDPQAAADPQAEAKRKKELEAQKAGGYQTRTSTPASTKSE